MDSLLISLPYRLQKQEAERLQEASGDKLDEEAKAKKKKLVLPSQMPPFSALRISNLLILTPSTSPYQ